MFHYFVVVEAQRWTLTATFISFCSSTKFDFISWPNYLQKVSLNHQTDRNLRVSTQQMALSPPSIHPALVFSPDIWLFFSASLWALLQFCSASQRAPAPVFSSREDAEQQGRTARLLYHFLHDPSATPTHCTSVAAEPLRRAEDESCSQMFGGGKRREAGCTAADRRRI